MDDRFRTHVTKDLTRGGSFPLSAVTSARLLRVTTPPGSSKDRGKTSCPQQLAQPRTTRDHQQGNGHSTPSGTAIPSPNAQDAPGRKKASPHAQDAPGRKKMSPHAHKVPSQRWGQAIRVRA